MSLEAKIEALTAAVIANTAALLGKQPPAAAGKVADKPATKPQENKADTQPAKQAITYDDVKGPFLELVKKDRAKALEVIGSEPFGLSSLKEAKPEQYAGLLTAITKASQ